MAICVQERAYRDKIMGGYKSPRRGVTINNTVQAVRRSAVIVNVQPSCVPTGRDMITK